MKKTFLALAATVLLAGTYAQAQTQESFVPTNTPSQQVAEAQGSSKVGGILAINDGSIAEGQGSGVQRTTQAEAHGQNHAALREAAPHQESGQGGTPM